MADERVGLRTVAVVGVDGSGKSTQATWLCEAVVQAGARAAVIHPFGWQFLSFLAPRSTHRSGSSAGRSTATFRRRLASGLVGVVELLDIGVYLWGAYLRSRLVAARSRQAVWLLSDRSVVDVLVKHRRRRALPGWVLRAWYRLVPRPQVTIWLSTSPAVAARRDAEFPLSYYVELHELYAQFSAEFGWRVVDTSDRTPEEVHGQVARALGIEARR